MISIKGGPVLTFLIRFRHPVVCGITTLDYDHTGILGDTIEQIAWQKAGIMKVSVVDLFDML